MEDEQIYKSHNKSLLLYHLVFPAKYRRKIFTDSVENTLKEICVGISERYEIRFIEIGVDDKTILDSCLELLHQNYQDYYDTVLAP